MLFFFCMPRTVSAFLCRLLLLSSICVHLSSSAFNTPRTLNLFCNSNLNLFLSSGCFSFMISCSYGFRSEAFSFLLILIIIHLTSSFITCDHMFYVKVALFAIIYIYSYYFLKCNFPIMPPFVYCWSVDWSVGFNYL